MKKYTLGNGIRVVFKKTPSKSVAVEVAFKVGSDYENDKVRGVSHFLEHMLFEGTKKRKTSLELASEIEKYGAEFNAYTGNERTAFFIKIINKSWVCYCCDINNFYSICFTSKVSKVSINCNIINIW